MKSANSASQFAVAGFAFLCFIVYFYFKIKLLLAFSLFAVLFVYGSDWYVAQFRRHLKVTVQQMTTKVSKQERFTFQVMIANTSRLPLVDGELHLLLSEHVQCAGAIAHDGGKMVIIPVQLRGRERKMVGLEVETNDHGVYQLLDYQLVWYDPFRMYQSGLQNERLLRHEALVYPERQPVAHMQMLTMRQPGERRTKLSPFYDETEVVSLRPYNGESFRHIHWTATAKTQELQVKRYAPVERKTLAIILSVASPDGYGLHGQLATWTEQVAYLCHFAEQQQFDYELMINMQTDHGMFHLVKANNRTHFIRCLEGLTRIDTRITLLSMASFQRQVEQKMTDDSTVIYVGDARFTPGVATHVVVDGCLVARGGKRNVS